MRNQMKFVIIIVLAAMVGGGLWAAGVSLFGGSANVPAEATVAVAKVNGQTISLYDLYLTYLRYAQQIEAQQGPLSDRSHEALRYQALEALVDSVLVNQELTKLKISASKAEVDEQMKQIVELFPSEEDFKVQLNAAGLTEAGLRNQLEHQIKLDKLQQEIVGHHEVSDEEVRQAYERVRVSHILIEPEGSSDEDWAAAEGKALEIYAQANTENFAELAQEFSADASSTSGGELGYIYRGRTVPEFEQAAFALEVGQISEPVRSVYGYHIITVTDRIEAEGEDFEKARPELEKELRLEKGQDDLEAWLDGLRESSEIVLMENRLNAFAQMQAENYEDAVHYYKLAIEEQPDSGYLYAFLGDAYHGLGDLEQAIAQYKLAAEKSANDYSLLYSLGKLYEEAEDVDAAVEQYLKAAELVRDDIFALLTLYYSVNALERYDDAMVIEKLIEEFQERQDELLKEQAATEVAEPEETLEEPAEAEAESTPQE
ncbi:peptidylprolyl isomerase [Candidatus Darwinibacter acetoxidans]